MMRRDDWIKHLKLRVADQMRRNVEKRNHNAVRRRDDIGWTISLPLVVAMMGMPCYYCGRRWSNAITFKTQRYGSYSVQYNGLDRLDVTRGYHMDNVVACCWDCNRARGDRSMDEFKAWIERIYKAFVA